MILNISKYYGVMVTHKGHFMSSKYGLSYNDFSGYYHAQYDTVIFAQDEDKHSEFKKWLLKKG